MKALALTYLGVCAAACCYYVARYVVVSRRMARADALLAARNDAWRRQNEAHQRLLDDLMEPVTKLRHIEISDHGVFIEATDPADAAEALYSLFCQPTRAA